MFDIYTAAHQQGAEGLGFTFGGFLGHPSLFFIERDTFWRCIVISLILS